MIPSVSLHLLTQDNSIPGNRKDGFRYHHLLFVIVLTPIYLWFELAFGVRLLDAMSGAVVLNDSSAIEHWGRLISGAAVALLLLSSWVRQCEKQVIRWPVAFAGGFGINRKLVVPTDLSRFGDYPLIQALDIAAQPQNPMDQLRALGQYFPMEKGTFWFAAGLSFNSFALVDGIAVVAVEIGDGLDINLLGLARMALPRPQVALVSIELALLVRFSSAEGVLWVQGQLTDNSWLLYPDIKLTGGFAFVIWFKGEHKGEFVLTLGGYHPDFHRDGYPQVPRLGLRWSIGSNIVIKSGSYFALTSEALMAGGDFEASAQFGPAWAEVSYFARTALFISTPLVTRSMRTRVSRRVSPSIPGYLAKSPSPSVWARASRCSAPISAAARLLGWALSS